MNIKSLLWDSVNKLWVHEKDLEPQERIDFPNGEYAIFYVNRYGKPLSVLFNSDGSVKQVQV